MSGVEKIWQSSWLRRLQVLGRKNQSMFQDLKRYLKTSTNLESLKPIVSCDCVSRNQRLSSRFTDQHCRDWEVWEAVSFSVWEGVSSSCFALTVCCVSYHSSTPFSTTTVRASWDTYYAQGNVISVSLFLGHLFPGKYIIYANLLQG